MNVMKSKRYGKIVQIECPLFQSTIQQINYDDNADDDNERICVDKS